MGHGRMYLLSFQFDHFFFESRNNYVLETYFC